MFYILCHVLFIVSSKSEVYLLTQIGTIEKEEKVTHIGRKEGILSSVRITIQRYQAHKEEKKERNIYTNKRGGYY
jgi:hypothetical protein